MAHDVFICHPTEDKATADAVVARLEAHKIRCWIAPRDVLPSEDWAAAIVRAIAGCKILVLVFSENTNRSAHVTREVEQAVQRGIPILPFRIADVMPAAALEYFIGGTHWLDALTPPLEQHLDRLAVTGQLLIERIREAQAEEEAAKRAAAPPPEELDVEEEVAAAIAETAVTSDATATGTGVLQWEVAAPQEAAHVTPPPRSGTATVPSPTPSAPGTTATVPPPAPTEARTPAARTEPRARSEAHPIAATPTEEAGRPQPLEPPAAAAAAQPGPSQTDDRRRRIMLIAGGGIVAALALLLGLLAIFGGDGGDVAVLDTTITAPTTISTTTLEPSTTLPVTTTEQVTSTTRLQPTTTLPATTTTRPPATTTTAAPTTTVAPTTTTRATTTTTRPPTTTTTTVVSVVARNDSYTLTNRRQICLDVTANDSGTAPLRVTAVSGSQFGSAKASDCGILYTPPDGIARPDAYRETLTYTLTDGRGATDAATVTISVS